MFNNQMIAGSSGQGGSFYPYSIDQSLRFDDGDNAYLERSPTSNGNKNVFNYKNQKVSNKEKNKLNNL